MFDIWSERIIFLKQNTLYINRRLGALGAPTSSWRPFDFLILSFAAFGRLGREIHADISVNLKISQNFGHFANSSFRFRDIATGSRNPEIQNFFYAEKLSKSSADLLQHSSLPRSGFFVTRSAAAGIVYSITKTFIGVCTFYKTYFFSKWQCPARVDIGSSRSEK